MVEALIERGIGEVRALVLDRGAAIEAHVERDDDPLRAGDLWTARLVQRLPGASRGLVRLGDTEALLEPLPPGLAEGGLVRVEVVREAVTEAGRPRLAKVAARPGSMGGPGRIAHGPTIVERLAARGLKLREAGPPGPDLLEAAGWSELLDTATTGHVPFAGGLLTLSPTPAMTVIDVDGPGAPAELARAAAHAVAAALRRFDLSGSIGIDFPTVADKAVRTEIGAILDAALPAPFERTAINGFGFVQIVRPRLRASLLERARDQPATAALALLRAAEHAAIPGPRVLAAAPAVTDWLTTRQHLLAELDRRSGRPHRLRAVPGLAISAGYAEPLP